MRLQMPGTTSEGPVCIVGAGSSGLAMCKALVERGVAFDCIERGSDVGGNWRYLNDSGTSSCYASLRTNVSRQRMQYTSMPMPPAWGDYIHHTQMTEYLGAFADRFALRPHIQFQTVATHARPASGGGWDMRINGPSQQSCTSERHYRALIVANGHDWDPNWPDHSGTFAGRVWHAHDYRRPAPFAGQRVLVIGAGNSASEIAVELAPVASRVYWSFRRSLHVIPRYVRRSRGPLRHSAVQPLAMAVGSLDIRTHSGVSAWSVARLRTA